jgi:ATP-dependent DNA ligase
MDCLPVASLPDASGWVYELKLDGFRGQGIRDRTGVQLLQKGFRKSALLSRRLCRWEPTFLV